MGRHSAYPLGASQPSAGHAATNRPEGGFFTGPVTDPRLFDLPITAAPATRSLAAADVARTAPAPIPVATSNPAPAAAPRATAQAAAARIADVTSTPTAVATIERGTDERKATGRDTVRHDTVRHDTVRHDAADPDTAGNEAAEPLRRPAPLPLIEPADHPEAHSASALIAAIQRANAPMALAPQTPPIRRQAAATHRSTPQFTGGPTPAFTSRLVAASLTTTPRQYVAPLIDEPVRVPRAFRRANRNNSVQFAACALAVLGVVSAAAVMAPQSPSEHLGGLTGPHPATAPIPLAAAAGAGAAPHGAAKPALPGHAAPVAATSTLAGRQSALLEPHTAQLTAPAHDEAIGGAGSGTVTVAPPQKATVPAPSASASASPAPAAPSPKPTPSASASPTPSPSASPAPSASAAPISPPSTGGGSLRSAVNSTSRGKTVSLAAGTFDFSNFGSNLIGIDMPGSIAGISGDSESTTVLQMTPHSSTKQGNVPTTHWKTNQLSLLRVSGSPTLKNFTLLATAQGHLYNGLRLNHTSNATITNVRVSGVPGNSDIPPGETFGINDFHTSNSSYTNVEVDGKNVGASGFATNGSANTSITGSYFHDNGHGNGATFWQTRNVTITDTTSTDNKDFAFNFERVSGTVKIVRPVMSGNNQGDLRFASDKGSANVTIIDPKFSGSKLRIKVNRTYLGVANKQQRSDIHVIINGVDRTSSVVTWIS